jgi:C4-dicarboxylate transporter DctQ subunit
MAFSRLLKTVETLVSAIVAGGFLFALGLNFANVVGRYAFRAPIYWAEEAMIFVFVWCIFLGAAVVALTGEHLKVGLLDWLLPPRAASVLAFIIQLTTVGVMSFVALRAATLVELVYRLGQTSIIGEIPMWVPYGAVLLGSVLIALASLLRAGSIALGRYPGGSGGHELEAGVEVSGR